MGLLHRPELPCFPGARTLQISLPAVNAPSAAALSPPLRMLCSDFSLVRSDLGRNGAPKLVALPFPESQRSSVSFVSTLISF